MLPFTKNAKSHKSVLSQFQTIRGIWPVYLCQPFMSRITDQVVLRGVIPLFIDPRLSTKLV